TERPGSTIGHAACTALAPEPTTTTSLASSITRVGPPPEWECRARSSRRCECPATRRLPATAWSGKTPRSPVSFPKWRPSTGDVAGAPIADGAAQPPHPPTATPTDAGGRSAVPAAPDPQRVSGRRRRSVVAIPATVRHLADYVSTAGLVS